MRLSRCSGRLALTAGLLALVACGGEGDTDDGATTPPAPATTSPPTATASPSPTATASPSPTTGATATPTPTVTETGTESASAVQVTGVDYDYEGVPDSVEAGTELEFTNESSEEAHELVLVRLPDTEERSIEELVQMSPEEQQQLLTDSLVGVSVAAPGSDGMVVEGDLVVDEPGRYLMVCLIPTDADPEEYLRAAAEAEGGPPQVEGGPPHLVNGMYAELTVE